MTIRKRGNRFQLVSSSGKVLGTHTTRAKAMAQEMAIHARKGKRARPHRRSHR